MSVREEWGQYSERFVAEGSAAEERDSLRRLVELCSFDPGQVVVDVGCGAGYTAFVLARTGVAVIAADPTHQMLTATRSGWSDRRLPDAARCVEAWAERLPLRDDSVDGVVCHRAAHQFADADAYLRECARVVRPGGIVGLADQSPPDGGEAWHDGFERERDPTHEHARSPSQWREAFRSAGLTIEADDVVYQHHGLESWCDRVDCPEERRAGVRRMLEDIPGVLREQYAPRHDDGGWHFRTPQFVVAARA